MSTRVKPTAPRVDPQSHMLVHTPPMSNLQRQRLFRERHPERDALYKARARVRLEMLYAVQWAGAAEPLAVPARPETLALAAAALPAARQLALPAIPVRLALPAPVEVPAFIAPLAKPEPVLVFAHERRQLERRAA